MNSEIDAKREVAIVLSDEFIKTVPDLAAGRQVWMRRTPEAERVAQRIWDARASAATSTDPGGVTLFLGEGDSERDLLSILDTVELHHGLASSEQPVEALRVLGTDATKTVRTALQALGYTRIDPVPDGFIAHWHRE
jgi:hypothetical protein